ncbi:MAG: hypothetical protein ACI9VS_003563 [Candidatus Binatia bacterium]|jgi:hypothetical protein
MHLAVCPDLDQRIGETAGVIPCPPIWLPSRLEGYPSRITFIARRLLHLGKTWAKIEGGEAGRDQRPLNGRNVRLRGARLCRPDQSQQPGDGKREEYFSGHLNRRKQSEQRSERSVASC